MGNDRHVASDIETFAAIKARNQLRRQAGLPPVELQQELNRVDQAREDRIFDRWMQSPLRYRVEQKLLRRLRRGRNNPTWTPNGMLSGGGLAFHVLLIKQMRKLRVRLEMSS
jgi:hypothetical protein